MPGTIHGSVNGNSAKSVKQIVVLYTGDPRTPRPPHELLILNGIATFDAETREAAGDTKTARDVINRGTFDYAPLSKIPETNALLVAIAGIRQGGCDLSNPQLFLENDHLGFTVNAWVPPGKSSFSVSFQCTVIRDEKASA